MKNRIAIIKYGLLLLCAIASLTVSAQSQAGFLSGTVYEVYQGQHEPAIGVNVAIENDQQRVLTGAATDVNGTFSLKVPADAKMIVVSFIGMETQRIPYTGQKSITVVMQPTAQQLGEVSISAAKAEVSELGLTVREQTAATQKIDMSSVVETLPVSSIEEALQGRLAGVDIISGGDPGAKGSIRIRGTATLNSSADPLIVINGVPYSTDIDDTFDFNTANNEDFADMLNLNPYDIESIEVLKDAASTAIYGTKAANGVLLITTKKGAKGKTNFTFSSKFTCKVEPESIPMLTGDEYVAFMQDAIWNTANARGLSNSSTYLDYLFNTPEIGYNPEWRYFNEYNTNTDWLSNITKNAWIFDESFTMSGGGEKATYRFSLSYMNEGGTSVGTGMDRITASYNLTYRFSDKLDMYAEFTYSDTNNKSPYFDNVRAEAMRKMPNKSPYWIDKETGLPTDNYFLRQNAEEFQGAFNDKNKNYHPIIAANESYSKTSQREEKINYRLNYKILPGFTYTGWVSMKFNTTKTRKFLPQSATDVSINSSFANFSSDAYKNTMSLQSENKLMYRQTFDVHTLLLTALWNTEQSRSSETAEEIYGAAAPGMSDPVTGGAVSSLGSGKSEARTLAVRGLVSYTLMDRYVVNFTANYEGRSTLSKANRWGFFPSVGLAWHVQEEGFMENLEWWNQFKLRASWGQSGNAPKGTAPYIGTYSSIGDYNTKPGIAPNSMQLNKLKWETSTEYNLGTDLGFMNNKLTMTFDYYHKITKDLLQTKVVIPSSVGYPSNQLAYFNSGKLSNIGWEYRIDYEIFKNKDWTVSANFNINRNINKIIELPENLSTEVPNVSNGAYTARLDPGVAVGAFYGFRYKGVYQNTEDTYARDADGNIMYDLAGKPITMKNGTFMCYPGDAKYEDINHDGKIDGKDVVYLGNYNPMITGGGGINVKYKGLGLTVFFHYRVGQKVINQARMDSEAMFNRDNQSKAVLNRWRNEGDDTDIPRALYDYGLNYLGSDRFVEDCSFLRLKTLSLSYNIPKSACKKMKINSLNIFLTGYDLLTFTSYKGQDPEVTLPSKVTDMAKDNAQTPRSRRFSFGFNINF